MATKTLGIKFEIAGVKEAQAGLNNLRNNLNRAISQNKSAVQENLSIARSDVKRAEVIEKTNQRIFSSYLGLRAKVRRETTAMGKQSQVAIKRQQREIEESVSDWFVGKFGSKSQKQNLIIKHERADFKQRSTYKDLNKSGRSAVLEQRFLLKEFVLDLKKIIKEDLKETLQESFSEVSDKESSFSKISKVAQMPFKAAGAGILAPIESMLFGGLQRIGEELVKDFAQGLSSQMQKNLGLQLKEVGQDIGGAIGSSMYLAYEKIMVATHNSVVDRHPVSGSNESLHLTKLLDDLGQILQGFVISLGAVPIKTKKRIDLDKKAIPLVKEKAGELMINRKLTEAQEAEIAQSKSITVLTGGANYDPQAGTTDFAYRSLQPMLKGSYVHPVKNLFSNAQGTPEFDRIFGEMLNMGLSDDSNRQELLKFAKENSDPEMEGALTDEEMEALFVGDGAEVSQKITDFFKEIHIPLPKILEVIFKGYNPDDIAMAAEGIFFKEKYPELPLQFLGTSFGGFNAAGSAELMNRMGYEDVKAVGVTTPLIGMESTVDPDNYMSSIGDLDFLYEMTLGSVFKGKVPKPDNLQVVPGKGKGHLLGHFLATSPEFRNSLQYFLKGRVDVPSMKEYSGKEVMAMGRIPGNNAESAIVRTIKKNLGEKHSEGYTFNQEDLIGHRDNLIKMAGGADLRKIKNPQLKEFYQDYIAFLDTLAEELETIEKFKQVGKKFKPVNSLRKAINFYPDLGHLVPNHPDFEMKKSEFEETNQEVEKNKTLVSFKRKIDNETGNIERTYRAMLGEDITEQGYGYYDDEEYETRANEHLNGLIDYLETEVLKDASDSERKASTPYLELLKKLKETILQVGKTGELDTAELAEAKKLLGINLKEYKSVLSSGETINVKDRKSEIQATANKAKQGKQSKLVMDVKPELEAYIWAINQELIREGKQQIDVATAEYLGSGYWNHAIKANNKVYKIAKHTSPLAQKVKKMMGGGDSNAFENEIKALAKLQGQDAPELIGGMENFVAMSEIEGQTVEQALAEASPEGRKKLIQDAAKLLKSFHARGIAHGDFYPANIIKGKDESLYGIDWQASNITEDPREHSADKDIAIERFKAFLVDNVGLETPQNIEKIFNEAYQGNTAKTPNLKTGDLKKTQQQIVDRYNQHLVEIMDRAGKSAKRAIAEGNLKVSPEKAYSAISQLMKEYRSAAKQGLFKQVRETGELILESSEYLKQVFKSNGDNRSGQLTRIQNEITQGDRGAGRSSTPLANLSQDSEYIQLKADLWEDTADGARSSLNTQTGDKIGSDFGGGISSGAKRILDINSPSGVFKWIGKMIQAGLNDGVSGIGNFLSESMDRSADAVRETVADVATQISDVASELDDSEGLLDPLLETEGADDRVNSFIGNIISKVSEAFDDLKQRFPVLNKISDFLINIGAEVLQLFGVFRATEALVNFSKDALNAAMELESLERSIVAVSRSAVEGANNIKFVRSEAQRLSVDLTSALENYQRILGATRGTALGGFQTEQIFSTLSETAVNRGLNTDKTNRLFIGFEQAISKGAFYAEETRGQLSEVLGDIQNIIASVMGVDLSMLEPLMKAGDVKAIEVMPKILARLDAQNAALSNSSRTAAAAQTRFSNALTEYKDAVGRQLQPVQKLGLNALSDALEILQNHSNKIFKLLAGLFSTVVVNITLKLLATKFVTLALGDAIYRLGFALGVIMPKLVLLLKRFVLITVAIQVWSNVVDLAKHPLKSMQDEVEASTKRLDALRKAFDDAGNAATKNSPKFTTLKLNEGAQVGDNKFLQGIAGGDRWNLDNFVRNRINWVGEQYDSYYRWVNEKAGSDAKPSQIKIVTQAQRKQNTFISDADNLINNSDRSLKYGTRAKSVLGEIATVDEKIRLLQSDRLDILPGDANARKNNTDKIQALQIERDKMLKKSSQYAETVAGDIQGITKSLLELDELDKTGGSEEEVRARENSRRSLSARLELLEGEKRAINEINSRIPTFLSQVDRVLRNSNERVSGFIVNQDDKALVVQATAITDSVAKGLSDTELELKLDNLSQSDLTSRIDFINSEIKLLESKLSSAYLQEGIQGLEKSAKKQAELEGTEYIGLTPDTLNRMLEEGRSSQETKAANLLLALTEYRRTSAQSELELANLLKSNRYKLEDFNRTISDYFFRISQQIKEARLETERLLSQIFYTDIKNRLRSAIAPGSNTFVNGIIDNISSVIDQAQQVAEKVFGDSASLLGFESESRTMATEMQDFIRQIGNAGDAVENFVNRLNGKPAPYSGGSGSAVSSFPIAGLTPETARITSGYGWRNIFGRKDFHEGIDIAASGGTDVRATNSGIVRHIKPLADQTQVGIETAKGVMEWFIHLGQNLKVGKGDRVNAGQVIGSVAHTTQTARNAKVSTGDHLDYRVNVNGNWVNPMEFIKSSLANKPTAQLVTNTKPQASNDVADKALRKNQELNALKKRNLGLTKLTTEQERENLAIAVKQTIEQNKRQANEGRKENARNLLGLEDKFADFGLNYDYQSAAGQSASALRQIKQQFLNADLDTFNQIRNTEDAIATITQLIPKLDTEIANLKEIGTPEALGLLKVKESAKTELNKSLTDLEDNLTKIEVIEAESAALQEKYTAFITEQNKLKEHQEKLNKRSLLLNQQATIAEARGTVEQQRKVKLAQEEVRLQQEIDQIKLNNAPGEQRDALIKGEQRKSDINLDNIDYQSELDELNLEKQLLDRRAEIDNKKAGFLSRIGDVFGSDKLKKQNAIDQENLRYKNELIEINRKHHGNAALLEENIQLATELNSVNLSQIENEFRSLGKTVEDMGISSFQGSVGKFVSEGFDVSGDKDKQLLEEKLWYAEEINQLNDQYADDEDRLTHLKDRAKDLNEQKLDKIKNEFNGFKRIINLAKQALLEFGKQLLAAIAQAAAAKIIGSIIGGAVGGASGGVSSVGNDFGGGAAGSAAFTANEGGTVADSVENFGGGGDIKKRKLSSGLTSWFKNNAPGVSKAFNKEGEGAQLGVFHTGEELLSRKTGEAPIYQALKSRLGVNPLQQLVANYNEGGTVGFDAEANILSGFIGFRPQFDLSKLDNFGGSRGQQVNKTINLSQTIVSPDVDSFNSNADQRNQDLMERLARGI